MDLLKKWVESMPNKHTKNLYRAHFKWFCKTQNVTPEELVNKNTPDKNEELLRTCLKIIEDKCLKRDVVNLQAGVNSFLRFYNKKQEADNDKFKDGRGRFKKIPEREKIYGWLIEYDVINEWIDEYTAENTRRGYLSTMSRFLQQNELKPDDLIEMPSKKLRLIFRRAKQEYIQNGKESMANQLYRVLASFCEAHKLEISFQKKDRVRVKSKRVKIQHIPTRDEVYRLADNSGTIRGRAIILCLAQSGVRNNCLRRWTYSMVKDYLYPELKIPVRLKITNEIDTKISYNIEYYYTFLQDEAADSLKSYIEWRKHEYGWQPKDNDFIFVSNTGKRLRQSTINDTMNRAAKNSGLNPETIWAHLLRKFFRKVLYGTPIDNDIAEAIMGHQIAGIKENYFDRYDLDWIASEYMKAPLGREGVSRLDHLEKQVAEKGMEVEELKEELEKTKETIEEMRELLDEVNERVSKD